MIFYIIVLLLVVGALVWLGQYILSNPGTAEITWGLWSVEMKTATLLLGILALCILSYFAIGFLRSLLGLRKRLRRMNEARLCSKANRSLSQGLIQLTEGHWGKAETLLTEQAEYSDTPVLNYLGAARAAHMQDALERRDEHFKVALEQDNKARVAVGVSQADMQLASGQLEQAYANLSNLREIAPKNSYVLKLLAKTLYKQANWDALLDLIPALLKQNLLKNEDMQRIQGATLQGLFKQHADNKNAQQLQAVWKKLPPKIRDLPEAMYIYAQSLFQAEAYTDCSTFISNALNQQWQDNLADLLGRIPHDNVSQVMTKAEKWQAQHADKPSLTLLMGRLYRQQKLWGMAKNHYELSLNQAPDTDAYLELAELLELMGEEDNAQRCYRLGLRHCVLNRSERLKLKVSAPSRATSTAPSQSPQLL